jgi:cell wall-associated NlpC family hydrolase
MPALPQPASAGPATASAIASMFLRYQGTPYLWGGYLPSTGWDCSGAVNYVLGNLLKMKLPGNVSYTGRSHGPIAAQYKAWTGATTVTSPAAGDLCCWVTHVGVYIGSGQMISALDPQYGTKVTPVAGNGPPGEPLSYRRISGTGSASPAAAAVGCLFPIMLPVLGPLVYLRSRRDHHRRAEVVGDDQDVVLG